MVQTRRKKAQLEETPSENDSGSTEVKTQKPKRGRPCKTTPVATRRSSRRSTENQTSQESLGEGRTLDSADSELLETSIDSQASSTLDEEASQSCPTEEPLSQENLNPTTFRNMHQDVDKTKTAESNSSESIENVIVPCTETIAYCPSSADSSEDIAVPEMRSTDNSVPPESSESTEGKVEPAVSEDSESVDGPEFVVERSESTAEPEFVVERSESAASEVSDLISETAAAESSERIPKEEPITESSEGFYDDKSGKVAVKMEASNDDDDAMDCASTASEGDMEVDQEEVVEKPAVERKTIVTPPLPNARFDNQHYNRGPPHYLRGTFAPPAPAPFVHPQPMAAVPKPVVTQKPRVSIFHPAKDAFIESTIIHKTPVLPKAQPVKEDIPLPAAPPPEPPKPSLPPPPRVMGRVGMPPRATPSPPLRMFGGPHQRMPMPMYQRGYDPHMMRGRPPPPPPSMPTFGALIPPPTQKSYTPVIHAPASSFNSLYVQQPKVGNGNVRASTTVVSPNKPRISICLGGQPTPTKVAPPAIVVPKPSFLNDDDDEDLPKPVKLMTRLEDRQDVVEREKDKEREKDREREKEKERGRETEIPSRYQERDRSDRSSDRKDDYHKSSHRESDRRRSDYYRRDRSDDRRRYRDDSRDKPRERNSDSDSSRRERRRSEKDKTAEVVKEVLKEAKELKEVKEEEQFSPEELVVPPFTCLDDSIYLIKSATKKKTESYECYCADTGADCSDDNCVNRSTFVECPSSCGSSCQNRRFAKRRYAAVEAYHTGTKKGCGLRALKQIQKGQFIIEYVGEVLEREDYEKRKEKYAEDKNHRHHYLCDTGVYIIDATKKGNLSRFINHSCEPNANCIKWGVPRTPGDVSRIGFFAKRDINVGEEITFNYQMANYGREAQKCFCGTASCSGWIGKVPVDTEDDESGEEEELVTTHDMEQDEEEARIESLARMTETQRVQEIDALLDELNMSNKKHTRKIIQIISFMTDYDQRVNIIEKLFESDLAFHKQMLYASEGMTTLLGEWLTQDDASVPSLRLKQKIVQTLHGEVFVASARGDKDLLAHVSQLAKTTDFPEDVVQVQSVVDAMVGAVSGAGAFPAQLVAVEADIFANLERLRVMAVRLNNHWFNRSVNFRIPKKVREPEKKEEKEEMKVEMPSRAQSEYRGSYPYRWDRSDSSRRFDGEHRRSYYNGHPKDWKRGRYNYRKRSRTRSRSRSASPHKRRKMEEEKKKISPERQAEKCTPSTSATPSSFGERLQHAQAPPQPQHNPLPNQMMMHQQYPHMAHNEWMNAWAHQYYNHPMSYYEMNGTEAPPAQSTQQKKPSTPPLEPPTLTKHNLPTLEQLDAIFDTMTNEELNKRVELVSLELSLVHKKLAHRETVEPETTAADDNEPTSTEPPPPPNRYLWARAKAPTGETYYYHKVTKETQWMLPRPEQGELDPNDRTPPQDCDSTAEERFEDETFAAGRCSSLSSRLEQVMGHTTEAEIEQRMKDEADRELARKKTYLLAEKNAENDRKREAAIKDFKISLEKLIGPIVRRKLEGVTTGSVEKVLWLIKLVAKEMFKRETTQPGCTYRLNETSAKKVRKYTETLMDRKLQNGAVDVWKGYRPL